MRNDVTAAHILFLNPPSPLAIYRGVVCTWVSKARYRWQPFDFILLSAFVPARARVSYLDSFVHQKGLPEIVDFIRRESVTQLVISLSSIQWQDDLNTLLALRREFPHLSIATMGDVFQEAEFCRQVLPEGVTIIRHPLDPRLADYFAGRDTAGSSLLRKLENNNGGLPEVKLARCIDLPLPRDEIFLSHRHRSPFDKYRRSATVNTGWGCPYGCTYCSWSSPYLPFVQRSAESVIRELKSLAELKVREVFFADLNFGYPQESANRILDWMLSSKWKFSWHCYIRPGALPEDFLCRMAAAGCHTVITGVESRNTDLSRFNRNTGLSDIKETIRIVHALKMDICGDFIVGLNEPAQNWRELAEFAISLNLDYASFNVYTPLLGSQERRRKIAEGTLSAGEWGFDTTGRRKSLIEHSENRNLCVKMFYSRPSYWFRRLRKIRTLDEFFIKLEEAMALLVTRRSAHG